MYDLSGIDKSEYILATRLKPARSSTHAVSPRHMDNIGRDPQAGRVLGPRSTHMKYVLMLAAAASFACAGHKSDEVGAAPDQGKTDTTAVAQDSTRGTPTDSTMGQRPGATDTTAVSQDTSSMSTPTPNDSTTSTGNQPSDTTSQSTGGYSDSTSMGNDSTMSMPADSAKQ